MNKEKLMNEETFNELVENLEILENLTLYGRKNIKYYIKKIQQENKQLREIINKLKNQPTVYLTKYMDKFGFVETKTLNELIDELESSDK